ncbi:MAG: HAD hydrolase family protein [Phycisphaerae bacterium]|nr:HAD hydrolase family protein [Phycisphaerae bacterium]
MDKKIKLLGLDVDGTLITPDQRIPDDVVEAIYDASDDGLRVCLATGRSYAETINIWTQLKFPPHVQPEPMIVVGGAMVCEPILGRTLYHKPFPPQLAAKCGKFLHDAGYSPMGFVDRWRCGVDYLYIPGDDDSSTKKRWFNQMLHVKIRNVESFDGSDAEPAPHILRINVVVDDIEHGNRAAAELQKHFTDELNIHAILAPNYGVVILEAFAKATSKWEALKYIAQSHRIGPGAIAAVGDDVNDIPMILAAGLGVAVANAKDTVKDAADIVAENGLADFIRNLP